MRELVEQTLALDPRPAYRRDDGERLYGTQLAGHDVRWRVRGGRAEVEAIAPLG